METTKVNGAPALWAPVPILDNHLWYASGTTEKGIQTIVSSGLIMIYVTGIMNSTAYGYIPAYNGKWSFYHYWIPWSNK